MNTSVVKLLRKETESAISEDLGCRIQYIRTEVFSFKNLEGKFTS